MLMLNIGMIHLEKISTKRSSSYKTSQYAFSDAMDHPGLIGIFFNNPEFGDVIKKQCKEKGLAFGERFGTNGVSVEALLQLTEPLDNYWFEITPFDFLSIPTPQREQLISIYNIIVFDYIDGGYHVELTLPKAYLNDERILNASGALDKFGNETMCIPVFPHITYMEAKRTGNIVPESVIDNEKVKRCIFPNHKPRPGRLATLARLDELDVLENNVEWSLTVNWEEEGEHGDFFKSPNVSLGRYSHSLIQSDSVKQFVQTYKSSLPKVLPNSTIELFKDCIPLNKRYAGNYSWKIACETYPHIKFNTEKTFKGFMAGMSVLTLGPKNLNKWLVNAGYIMEYSELYDHLEFGEERIEAVIDIMLSKQPNLDAVRHNYKLSHDVEFLASLVVNPLVERLVPSDDIFSPVPKRTLG
tara:strand:+ start:597 stop:1835 length:1239 start_codon:yes stop_codon:yes gene_type:complete